jgi:hypothetical protein
MVMHLSETLVPEKSARKDTLDKVEERLGVAEQKIKNALELASLSNLVEQRISNKIYRQSATYSNFEVL